MQSKKDAVKSFERAARPGQRGVISIAQAAMIALGEGIDEETIAAALANRSAIPIYGSQGWSDFISELTKIYEVADDSPIFVAMKKAAQEAHAVLPGPFVDPAAFQFERVFDRARSWMRLNGAQRVTAITASTRKAIQAVIDDAFAEPLGVQQAARRMLDIKALGLNDQQRMTLMKYGRQLEVEGGKPAAIQSKMRTRYKQLRRKRARLIAKTESYDSAAAAQRQLWVEAVQQDQLNVENYLLEWVTRVLRVCPRCIALNGKTAEIEGGQFVSDTIVGGGKFDGTQIVVERPTVHPDCYCAMRMIRRPRQTQLVRAPSRFTDHLVQQAATT